MQHSQHVTLFPLLPAGKSLFLDYEQESLFLLAQNEHPEQHVCMTRAELTLLAALLTTYPASCSYAQLLAATSQRMLSVCQEQVQQAKDKKQMDELLCELRGVLASCNQHLEPLTLQIVAVFETGYLLVSRPARCDEQRPERAIFPRGHWRRGMLTLPPFL